MAVVVSWFTTGTTSGRTTRQAVVNPPKRVVLFFRRNCRKHIFLEDDHGKNFAFFP